MTLNRRKLIFAAAGIPAVLRSQTPREPAPAHKPPEFPKAEGLTREVAEFIVGTRYDDLPADVVELGRKSILDGLGLALCGSVAETGPPSREYVKLVGP